MPAGTNHEIDTTPASCSRPSSRLGTRKAASEASTRMPTWTSTGATDQVQRLVPRRRPTGQPVRPCRFADAGDRGQSPVRRRRVGRPSDRPPAEVGHRVVEPRTWLLPTRHDQPHPADEHEAAQHDRADRAHRDRRRSGDVGVDGTGEEPARARVAGEPLHPHEQHRIDHEDRRRGTTARRRCRTPADSRPDRTPAGRR